MVSIAEFINDEFLHADDVYNIKQSFECVESQNAKLIGYTAVAVFSKYEEH